MDTIERRLFIKQERGKGRTLADIGRELHISRERVRQIADDVRNAPRVRWSIASQSYRRTCFICRSILESPSKYCKSCIKTNKLDVGGRDLVRGVVRGRDNNTCQVCGYVWNPKQPKRLDVHHLDGLCGKLTKKYDNFDMMNKLITVCHKCHYNLEDHRHNGRVASEKRIKKQLLTLT